MQDIINKFAKNLRTIRKNNCLTQKQLAEKIGVSEKSVSKWEVGKALPPSILLPDLANALGIALNVLFEYENEPRYFLGIDGGGTKTDFKLCDENGKTVNQITLGPSNPVDIGIDRCFKVLEEGINTVCGGIKRGEISVFAGLAGGISGNNKEKVGNFLSHLGFCRYANGSDTENALEAALKGENGIAVIMGTGIIAFAQKNGERRRIGGWGYLLDSGGSGYNFGRDALESALRFVDGRGEKTILLDLIEEKLQGSLPDAIPDIYCGGKAYIARFAPLVFTACERGDSVANEILNRNISAAAEIIRVGMMHLLEKAPVVLCGGLVKGKSQILEILSQLIPDTDIRICEESMVQGAVALARRNKNA